jgi:hypothetical protein
MSKWNRVSSPKDKNYGSGWCGELDRCWVQGNRYVVMSRKIMTDWGIVEHICIRNASNTDIPWSEKQRIKNELFGKDVTAIEVFPRDNRLIDEAGMYHLWILPDGFDLPFGLHEDDVMTESVSR